MEAAQRLIVALDVDDMATALALVDLLGDTVSRYKVGYRLFLAAGWQIVEELEGRGKWVFCDLKLHDIPATVAGAIRTMAHQNIGAVTLHAFGGSAMLRAAVEAVHGLAHRPLLWAVTVLTSLDETALRDELMVTLPLSDYAVHLARLARFCGCDGVIASGHEIERIKESCGDDFQVIVPAVRLVGADAHDQRRIITPDEAIRRGADFLVVGRAVTQSENPRDAFLQIAEAVGRARV